MEQVAERVWKITGGFPRKVMHVYLIEEDDGITVFDAGIRSMKTQILGAVASLGRLKQVVLGHAHPDHRGAARGLVEITDAEVWCHRDERNDVESGGGVARMHLDLLAFHERVIFKYVLFKLWDGGPVTVSRTLEEGDAVAGFSVYHMPGHSPGQITLYREGDGVALCSDLIYTIDPRTGKEAPASAPLEAFTADIELARQSIRKLAGLGPKSVWAGHGQPITEDVQGQLLLAAKR